MLMIQACATNRLISINLMRLLIITWKSCKNGQWVTNCPLMLCNSVNAHFYKTETYDIEEARSKTFTKK